MLRLICAHAFLWGWAITWQFAKTCQGTRPGDTVTPLQFFVEIGVCRANLHE
jgi:hypothetical protein